MEFDEMKKIWDTQNSRLLFAIDEEALHKRVRSKKQTARHIASFTEWLLILINLAMTLFVFAKGLYFGGVVISSYFMAAWMIVTIGFVVVHRVRRLRNEKKFDRSVSGDLEHALANATYQVRLSWLMRWNIIPITLFVLLAFWERGTPIWIVCLVMVLMVLAHFGSGWEHRIYVRRREELENLYKKLTGEPEIDVSLNT